jgi:hypothetical protein
MRNFAFIILFSIFGLMSCKKEEPVIADPMELAITSLSENFICQPVAFDNSVVAVINEKNQTYLCNYDNAGRKIWQNQIDQYALGSLTIQNMQKIDLKKDAQNNIIMSMNATLVDQNQKIISQKVKLVKFDQGGIFLNERTDSIHQPKGIRIQQDTISMTGKGPFVAQGIVCLSGGNYAIISTFADATTDSTYLQVSSYNSSLTFASARYFRMKGQRTFIDIYSDSSDHLFLISTLKGSTMTDFLLTDLNGNLIFNIPTTGYVLDSYFFKETRSGQYVVSTSFLNSTVELRGVVVCLTKTGQAVWANLFDLNPSWIMLSMNELPDGYIFSGFNSDAILLKGVDWRTTFTENPHQAVILRTGTDGREVWHRIMDGNFTSAAAISIGTNPISCFGGKYEASGKNMFLVKLTEGGDFYY